VKKILYIHTFLLILLCLAFSTEVLGQAQSNPNSAKACAICHYRWIDTFFVEGKGSDLVEYQSEKVVATPDMCFSCHDGSVKDSMEKLGENSGHKINKPPPPHMKIPDIFPLGEDGTMQCSTCHTAHGVQGGPDSEDTIFMRTSDRDAAMCRMCHPTADGGKAAGNHPVDITRQKIPKKLVSLGAVVGRKKDQIICETCHTAHGSPFQSFLVDSIGNSALCFDCHSDKNIFAPDGTRKPFHVINAGSENVTIPEDLINKGAKLGPKGVVTCLTCHKVHHNKNERQFLLVMGNEKSSLCLACHTDKKYLANTKHNLINSAPGERNLEGKTVAEAGVCSACHLPHKPARKLSSKKDLTTRLCLSCHSEGNIAGKVRPPGYTHPLDVSPFEKKEENLVFAAVDAEKSELALPLFNKHTVQDKDGNLTCLTCHDTHGTAASSIQRRTATGSKSKKANSLLRVQSPDLCRECHNNKFYIANSKHDLSKVAADKDMLKQKPSEPGICGSCHLVHGPQGGFLWLREKPTQKNARGAEEFCIGCHSESGLARKKVIKRYSHHVNISPDEREVENVLPLFDQYGKVSNQGVMTCQTCHDPHRWDPLKILDGDHCEAEGNSQNSFLRLENSPSPELCNNCHPDKANLERTDHDLIITAPAYENILGQTPVESGTCGVCHLVHNSKNKAKLWAQEFGDGMSVMERMCNSCHSENGSAKGKIPRIATHPQGKIVDLGKAIEGKVNYLPLFDDTSGEPVSVGSISCPSCHNVHQWDPKSPTKGKGVNLEGNATNSFLRTRSPQLMCKDCHGFEALVKFKFFHDPTMRTTQGSGNLLK
jgi:predicted CXXCH cytochrome family protein